MEQPMEEPLGRRERDSKGLDAAQWSWSWDGEGLPMT